MGYYSNFYVTIRPKGKFSITDFVEALENRTGYYISSLHETVTKDLHSTFYFDLLDVKFYSYEDVFLQLSEEFPQLKIFVSRVGEDSRDYEEDLFEDGECMTKELEIIWPKWEDEEIDHIFSYNRQD